jgi:L-ascorbate metabolism protein UlaG (beta-lactamase superfamily)
VELQYFGANCVRLTIKKTSIVVDDNLEKLGLRTITKPTDISLLTSKEIPVHPALFVADMPGEYEISNVIVQGIAARAHLDEEGEGKKSIIYTITTAEAKVAVIGHIYPELDEDQLEQIGMVDIAIVPVGGNGYTLDGVGALKVIKQIEPKIVIPTHYADRSIRYEVPPQELNEALKGLAMEPAESVDKYKYSSAELSDSTHLVVLERQ